MEGKAKKGERGASQLVEYHNKRREHLAGIKVERSVETIEQAKDPKTLEYCIAQLNSGVGWDELRRKLGLGPAHVDPRWAEIRKHLFVQVIPDSPEQALVAAYTEQMEANEQMREFLREVDAMIDRKPETEEEAKSQHQYYKLKLDTLKALNEKAGERFKQFVEVKKLKHANKGRGVTIKIVQNIPRPEPIRDVVDTTKVIECKKTK